MTPMETVAHAAALALTEPVQAAAWFLASMDDETGRIALRFIEPPGGFAHMDLGVIRNFEETGQPVLIRGVWGDVWFCPTHAGYPELNPRVTPRGLRALGRALITHLAQLPAEPEPAGLVPWEESWQR